MILSKTIPTLSLALAMIGGAVMFAPSAVKAAGFISNGALRAGGIPTDRNHRQNTRPGAPANHHTRDCSGITRCRG
jgi:hypothetical protein